MAEVAAYLAHKRRDLVGAVDVQFQRRMREPQVAIDEIPEVIAIIDEQVLTDQGTIIRYRPILGVFSRGSPSASPR